MYSMVFYATTESDKKKFENLGGITQWNKNNVNDFID